MKHFLFIIFLLALYSCKTQTAVAPLVIRDSISITYKQGETLLTPLIGEKSEEISPTAKAVLQRSGPTGQSPVVQRSGPAPVVRVDTVFIERWHAEVCQPQAVCQRSGPSAEGGLSAKRSQFYKNCTLGFWILLIVFLGSFGFRILKAIYLKR